MKLNSNWGAVPINGNYCDCRFANLVAVSLKGNPGNEFAVLVQSKTNISNDIQIRNIIARKNFRTYKEAHDFAKNYDNEYEVFIKKCMLMDDDPYWVCDKCNS